MWNVALSTIWGFGRFENLNEFFTAAKQCGFSLIELNHQVDSANFRGTYLNGHKVQSVHEPCPADISMNELRRRDWEISSLDDENRRQRVIAICRSIDMAVEYKAKAIVIHPGIVNGLGESERKFVGLYKSAKGQEGPEVAEAREKLVKARAAVAEAHVKAVKRSLQELAEYAAPKGIRLGLENRYHYPEIPLPDELEYLMEGFSPETVGHWHDVGHALTLAHLGFHSHEEWLRRFSSRIIGIHLHDVKDIQDHWAAGLGQMDWPLVKAFLPDTALRTCEFQYFNTPEQLIAGMKYLQQTGIISEL